MKMRTLAISLFTLALTMLVASSALAHRVNLFGYAEGGQIHVEGYYTDGAPSVDSRIEAVGPDGNVIARGVTADNGRFSFPAAEQGHYLVRIDSSLGHVAQITVEVGSDKAQGSQSEATSYDHHVHLAEEADIATGTELDALTEKVERLGEEVAGLRKALEKPGVAQIVGGLGFIVGLAGAYLWGVSRKNSGQ